ncbi:amyloid-beta precursor protein-like [Mya arenaria]|uniref:amyloid-beta precursor protein-like n=1 Tax=Mya arenaria TaxID=6604 RepID=UPI0022E43621|nr:amyloid-beta precursor protein-like [Mya arenaria]
MPAMKLFEMSIRFLRDHLVNALKKQVDGIKEFDILYVITVPAIWNDGAKQFMREAAVKAGLDSERIKLALEPEAASADQHEPRDRSEQDWQSVHGRRPWSWLTKVFGETTMSRFREEEMEDYFGLLREFETKKRMITPYSKGRVTFRLPIAIRTIHDTAEHQSIDQKLERMKITNDCTLTVVPGPCLAYFPRYYYNMFTDLCQKFIYGGCQGNANNFHTLEECEHLCSVQI